MLFEYLDRLRVHNANKMQYSFSSLLAYRTAKAASTHIYIYITVNTLRLIVCIMVI